MQDADADPPDRGTELPYGDHPGAGEAPASPPDIPPVPYAGTEAGYAGGLPGGQAWDQGGPAGGAGSGNVGVYSPGGHAGVHPAGYGTDSTGYGNAPAGYETGTAGYGNAPAGYEAGTAGHGNAPAGYETGTAGHGNAPAGNESGTAGYGNAPAAYEAGPAGYGSGPAGFGTETPGLGGGVDGFGGEPAGHGGGGAGDTSAGLPPIPYAAPYASGPAGQPPAVQLPPTPYDTGALATPDQRGAPEVARPYVAPPATGPPSAPPGPPSAPPGPPSAPPGPPSAPTGFLSAPPPVGPASPGASMPAWPPTEQRASQPMGAPSSPTGPPTGPPPFLPAEPARSPSAPKHARTAGEAGEPAGRRRWILALAGVAVVLAGALVAIQLTDNGRAGAPVAQKSNAARVSPPPPAASGGQGSTGGPGESPRATPRRTVPTSGQLPVPPANGTGACGAQGTLRPPGMREAVTAQRCALRFLGPTGKRIPVYRTRSGDSRVVGWLNRAGNRNWFVGEALGGRFAAAGDFNTNWAYTRSDTGAWGWVSGLYFAVGTSGKPDPSLLACGTRCRPYD
jgi:hypothetical protein